MMSMIGPAAVLIARFGDPERIRAQHSPDEQQRCRACTTPGYGTPHAPWPCLLHVIATNAVAQVGAEAGISRDARHRRSARSRCSHSANRALRSATGG